jgi:pimeloyl-ACP methyl ester carboxylesterase
MTTTRDRQVLELARARRPDPASAPALTRHRGGSGQPLVLLHGLGLSWRSWQPVLDALEDRHDVVAIDLPGFGESPPLPDGVAPTPGRLADAVESELDRLGLDAPALVGNSLGGWVALELARRGRAARAVVISPSGLESPLERALVIALNEQMRLRARFGAPLGQWLTAPALARVMLFGGLRSQPWRLSPDAAVRDLHDFGYSPGFQSTLGSTVASRAAMWLGEIEVPVRVAYGTLDLMLGVFTAPRFAAAIPVAELSRCQHSDTSRCSTIQSSWPERSSTSPLTPGRRHDERPPGRHVLRPGRAGRACAGGDQQHPPHSRERPAELEPSLNPRLGLCDPFGRTARLRGRGRDGSTRAPRVTAVRCRHPPTVPPP